MDSLTTAYCPLPPQSGVGDMEMPGVRPRYVVSTLRFLFVDQLISNLHTSIILGISNLSSKLGKDVCQNTSKFLSATISAKIDI